ncbi:hypothetical protein LXL04_017115 [Taraxacum kok-saghyz]
MGVMVVMVVRLEVVDKQMWFEVIDKQTRFEVVDNQLDRVEMVDMVVEKVVFADWENHFVASLQTHRVVIQHAGIEGVTSLTRMDCHYGSDLWVVLRPPEARSSTTTFTTPEPDGVHGRYALPPRHHAPGVVETTKTFVMRRITNKDTRYGTMFKFVCVVEMRIAKASKDVEMSLGRGIRVIVRMGRRSGVRLLAGATCGIFPGW